MENPTCYQRICDKEAQFYIPDYKIYECSKHKDQRKITDEAIRLVTYAKTEDAIGWVQTAVEDFLEFFTQANNGMDLEEYQELAANYQEKIDELNEEFKQAAEYDEYFKYKDIQMRAQDAFNSLRKEDLFVKFTSRKYIEKIYSDNDPEGDEKWMGRINYFQLKSQKKVREYAQKLNVEAKTIKEECEKEIDETNEKIDQVKTQMMESDRSFKQQREGLISSHNANMKQLQEAHESNLQVIKNKLQKDLDDQKKILQNSKEALEKNKAIKENKLKSADMRLKEAQKKTQELLEIKKEEEKNYETMKQLMIASLHVSDYSDFSCLYNFILKTGENRQINPKTRLTLSLTNPKHMEFLTSLEQQMPDLEILSLRKIPLNSEEVKTFLGSRFPSKVRIFHFNFSSPLSSSLPLYMDELAAVSQRVWEALFIYKFEVSQSQLTTLLAANKHKEPFGFTNCKLSLSSVPDFGGRLEGSTLEILHLDSCGGSDYGDWATNESHFENLVEGLSKEQDFKNNLQGIRMRECGMELETVEEILVKHGFGHVEIVAHSK
ncbi:unnamed protein product [Moneuplotes crassus]|uniref:Uncharacterized protein n=1 Tax=Euplotes crassus TaxID=5936 RepID=A0AAD1U827_EUPCR|nr:unnamed protein product [Moneuplotes crassus]